MELERIQAALKNWHRPGALHFQQTLTSAVTTAWGVAWDESYIARDLMQNFFDANRDRLVDVVVRRDAGMVAVTAPTPFALERLFYLGSEKGEDDIGKFGEGFKAAATCLLRDHRTTPIVASGDRVVCLRVAKDSVADSSQLYPVEYDFYRCANPVPGAILILANATKKLAAAMETGLTHFLHDENPLLGLRRWRHREGHFTLYDSTDGRGHIFYRKLKRGEMEGIPVVLVIDKAYEAIERKTRQDRDRKAFGEELLVLFYRLFAKNGVGSAWSGERVQAERAIVTAAQGFWKQGHPILSWLGEASRYGDHWDEATARQVFGNKYFARARHERNPAAQVEIERMERAWSAQGRTALPSYFRSFGVPSAEDVIKKANDQANREARQRDSRAPTAAERESLQVLQSVLREFSPEIVAVFDRETTRYTVAKTDVLLGELRSQRGYRSREVFFAEAVFVSDFAHALAIYLHEHAHIFGHDGSRGFTDALTELLETVVMRRNELNAREVAWEAARIAVCRERAVAPSTDEDMHQELARRSAEELRAIMLRIPRGMLNNLIAEVGSPGESCQDKPGGPRRAAARRKVRRKRTKGA